MQHEATARPQLSQRGNPAELAEWMDGPCSYEDFRACLVDLAQVNCITAGYRPTLRWLDQVVRAHGSQRPLHIVDVGCGGGDTLARIAAWAKKRGVAVKLTGIDLNPYAVRAAQELTPSDIEVQWVAGDAYAFVPSAPIDIVLNSLVMHHLTEPEILRFLAWMESIARLGWFINDLERTRLNFHGFQLLARLYGWHRFVQHDGPVSFRRSFVKSDWRRLCVEAGITLSQVSIVSRFPGRLCVGRIK
jgi:SAM-dependent methyltransferase